MYDMSVNANFSLLAGNGLDDPRWIDMNLSIDWRKMDKPRARRKTPLKKAPRS
jgi:hypothetical protein